MRFRIPALLLLAAVLAFPALAQKKYNGPRPPKSDVPFLLQAGKLTEVESGTATEGQSKEGPMYTVNGAASPTRTPVPEPVFLFLADKVNPDRLSLYRMDTKTGNRTLVLPPAMGKRKKDAPRPIFLMVSPLSPGLFKVEVNEVLENGEYCLSPEGSNKVFCFAAY